MSRITVLAFVACYLPGYKSGGPVRTITNMVEKLGDEFDFRIKSFTSFPHGVFCTVYRS